MYSTTLANFCGQISLLLDRSVVDKTGIAGVFDILVEVPSAEPVLTSPTGNGAAISSPDSGADRPRLPTAGANATDPMGLVIFSAVQKIGLKLESAKGGVEVLVIDRVEKPSEN